MAGEQMQKLGPMYKFMVPIAVLIVCAAAFCGSAYAYSSSVTTTGNTVTVDAEMLILKETDSASVTVSFNVGFIHVNDKGVESWSIDGNSKLSDTFKIRLESTNTVDVRNVRLTVPATISVAGNTFSVTVSGTGVSGSGTTYTVPVTPSTADVNNEVEITITLAAVGTITTPMAADRIQTFDINVTTASA